MIERRTFSILRGGRLRKFEGIRVARAVWATFIEKDVVLWLHGDGWHERPWIRFSKAEAKGAFRKVMNRPDWMGPEDFFAWEVLKGDFGDDYKALDRASRHATFSGLIFVRKQYGGDRVEVEAACGQVFRIRHEVIEEVLGL